MDMVLYKSLEKIRIRMSLLVSTHILYLHGRKCYKYPCAGWGISTAPLRHIDGHQNIPNFLKIIKIEANFRDIFNRRSQKPAKSLPYMV